MKLLGLFLLFSGWCLALAAFSLLKNAAAIAAFLLAALAVECLGLGMVAKAHIPNRRKA